MSTEKLRIRFFLNPQYDVLLFKIIVQSFYPSAIFISVPVGQTKRQ